MLKRYIFPTQLTLAFVWIFTALTSLYLNPQTGLNLLLKAGLPGPQAWLLI